MNGTYDEYQFHRTPWRIIIINNLRLEHCVYTLQEKMRTEFKKFNCINIISIVNNGHFLSVHNQV